jgi:phosphoglycerate dehydrogenase-like enzyme
MKIFVALPLSDKQRARLRDAAGAELRYHPDPSGAARLSLQDCEVAFGNPPAEWLADAPGLRWVQLESVGFGEYAGLDRTILGRTLRLTNLKGFFAEPVAQSILGGILSHYRGIGRLADLQSRGAWVGDDLRPQLRTLSGASVVLFGYGDINRRVAELLAPFGCSITAFHSGWHPDPLTEALGKADIVVCAAPHTAATKGLFDARMLAKLSPGALFVNFGRGSLLDEDALADALDSGRLGGAVIDVTREEPLPPSHRFWRCPNLLLTQHTGGGTGDEIDRKIDVFLANLERYRKNEALYGLVDVERGY